MNPNLSKGQSRLKDRTPDIFNSKEMLPAIIYLYCSKFLYYLFFILNLLLVLNTSLFSQQLPVFQQYVLHPPLINPAITGSSECSEFVLTDRHQWFGIKGAPSTQILCAETAIVRRNRSHGIGIHLFNDINGAHKQLGGNAGYAFHVNLNRTRTLKLGFGLVGMIYQSALDERDFNRINDPVVSWNITRAFNFNASTGVYLYHEKFFAGLSAVQLLPTNSSLNTHANTRTFFLFTGMNFYDPERSFIYHPSLLYSFNLEGDMHANLNIKIIYRESSWILFSYRHNLAVFPGFSNSLVTYIGVDFKNASFAYGFDLGLTALQKYHYGSHEFKVGYRLCPFKYPCPAYE